MTQLKILRKCFAYSMFVFAMVSLAMLPALIRAPFPHRTAYFHVDVAGIILIIMRETLVLTPPVLAVVNGIAWWTVRKGRPSARRWAMTASSLLLVFSIPFFAADIVMFEYGIVGAVDIVGVFLSSLIFSGLGIAGLAFFSRCEALTPVSAAMAHHA